MKPSVTCQSASQRTHRTRPTPFTPGEVRAKLRAEQFLAEARYYASLPDLDMAVRSCMLALRQTFGIARYLMVRDQTDDLLARIDPLQMLRRRLNFVRSTAATLERRRS